jgi:hypothetical protein
VLVLVLVLVRVLVLVLVLVRVLVRVQARSNFFRVLTPARLVKTLSPMPTSKRSWQLLGKQPLIKGKLALSTITASPVMGIRLGRTGGLTILRATLLVMGIPRPSLRLGRKASLSRLRFRTMTTATSPAVRFVTSLVVTAGLYIGLMQVAMLSMRTALTTQKGGRVR